MALASLIVAVAALTVAVVGVGYSRLQTQAALRQADAAKIQADVATAQVLAQAKSAERQQASTVKLVPARIGGAGAGVLPPESVQLVHMAVITNESGRPIRNVACRITPEGQAPRLAAVVGQLMEYHVASNVVDEALVYRENTDHWRLVPAGLRCGFVFPFDVEGYPKVQMEARFADDVGVNWEIDHEQHLLKLEKRDGW
jgi:hypothetical protein